jgi:hypothetical protein
MLVDSLLQEGEHAHLWGDVPILFVAAALLWWLRPSQSAEGSASP